MNLYLFFLSTVGIEFIKCVINAVILLFVISGSFKSGLFSFHLVYSIRTLYYLLFTFILCMF